MIFVELNAGTGTFTAAVVIAGVEASPPNDPCSGGTNLDDLAQVEALWAPWVGLHKRGYHLVIHWAPPCGAMSRARQRNWQTVVRTATQPWGVSGL